MTLPRMLTVITVLCGAAAGWFSSEDTSVSLGFLAVGLLAFVLEERIKNRRASGLSKPSND